MIRLQYRLIKFCAVLALLPGLLCAQFFPSAIAAARDEVAIPALTQRITDLTHTLAADQISTLESKLRVFEQTKGSQIVILILPTTQPDDIAQYTIRLADAWKIGRKGVGDGVIIVVAKNDHKLRIEVGRGLEGVIPDIYAKRIIAENIAPLFKQGDMNGGLNAGVDKIIGLVSGEALPPAPKQSVKSGMSFESQLVFFLVACLLFGGFLSSVMGRFLGSATTGVALGGISWLLAGALGTSLLLGVLGFIFTLLIPILSTGIGFTGGGGFGGGMSGGGMSGGGMSGGGFSGGGGDFGGGGASGDW